LKEQNADEIDIKKMNEQILETAQMLPNSKVRIENALEDLKNFMSEHEDNEELKATEDWQVAEGAIAEISAFVESI
jgi:cbb3-type cytochrome oxidase cytochrome c subunit